MTVRELIELNQMITDIEIIVLDDKMNLLDELNIGPSEGKKPPYPTRVPTDPKYASNMSRHDPVQFRNAAYIPKSINAWDDGKDYWQVKPNRLPKGWGDLEVYSWEVWPAHVVGCNRRVDKNGSRNNNFYGERIGIVAYHGGQKLSVQEPTKEPDDGQLEGQMGIEDFL